MNLHTAPRARKSPRRTLLVALLTILFAAVTHSETPSDGPPPPPFNGIAHVAIRVHDLAASVAFYQKLGFEQAFDLRKNDIPYESFIKINDNQFIELYPVTEKDPAVGFLHLCFEGADLNAIYADYSTHGLTPTVVRKAGAGNLLFTLAGPLQPSGPQNIEYTQYMPGSLHSNDQGKHLGPNRVADKLIAVDLAMKDPAAARDFYINQLHFKPIANDQMDLHMPGESGQEVEIVPVASLGAKARLTLGSENLSKSAHLLHKEGVAAVKNGATLTITDPDGNILILETR
ncbi:MAG TPA: VOC family protein [Edaphobacter sp.]|jgi:catechol 2,3-dioxygenase-like lactoylglutathione lyase family enzyme|nr:VOC family protein [Edaphobacter sp.]